MAHVVIAGGGFGGLAAAHELRGRLGDDDEITLVARSDRFFMGFAKLWDLGGLRPLEEGSLPLANLERHGVRFVQADVAAIDPEARAVETSAGRLEGDAVLVALGAAFSPTHLAMLSGAGAHNLYDAAALPAIRADLDALEGGTVVVAILGGPFLCPPAPYEAALIVSERLRERAVRDTVDVMVVTPQPVTLPVAGPDASAYVAARLADHDIGLQSEVPITGVDPEARHLLLGDNSQIGYTVLLGVPAAAPPAVLQGNPLAGPSGWIEPDRHTLRTAFPGVYAVGDCTHIPNAAGALPKAGVFAAGEGRVAAANIAADLGRGEGASFDGHGFCFLELPGRRVAFVEGDFYAEPKPDVTLSEADDDHFRRKQAYESEHLQAWLG